MDKRPRDEGADGDDGAGKNVRASSAAGAVATNAACAADANAACAADAEALRSLPREALSAAGANGRTAVESELQAQHVDTAVTIGSAKLGIVLNKVRPSMTH